MYELLTKVIIILFILVICYLIYNVYAYNYNLSKKKCELEKFDIDDIMVVKRTPEYSKLINKLIDEKSFIFNEQQIKSFKNPQQIFKLSKNKQDIENISEIVYDDCNKELDLFTNTYTYDYSDNNIDNNIDVIDNQYEQIKNNLKNDINVITEPNCTNTGVLKNNIPFSNNYLKNYYKDLYGNYIEADLKDYFTAYYTLINSNDDVGLPVNTQIGNSNFIIPDQYKYDSKFTNAYNIDWSRIINPIGYSM
jgi:hypothetical protein